MACHLDKLLKLYIKLKDSCVGRFVGGIVETFKVSLFAIMGTFNSFFVLGVSPDFLIFLRSCLAEGGYVLNNS